MLTMSAKTLPPKTRKLVITLTTTILTQIWKTRNRLQSDDKIILTTNTIINIKNELKCITQTHYKQHIINDILQEFQSKFCISNAQWTLHNNALTLKL